MSLIETPSLTSKQSGMTLIEIVLVLGLLGVAGVLMSQIMMNSMSSQQRLQATSTFENLDNTLRSLMALGTTSTSGTNTCLLMFKGKNGTAPTITNPGTQLTNLYYPDGSTILTVGRPDPSGLNTITAITLAAQSGTTCNANSNCALVLTINGTKAGSTVASRPIVANFSGSVDGSKVLTGCSYQSSNNVPVGNLTIVHSGQEKAFINSYQTPVTVRAIVQGAGGGGSQGGPNCSGNDPGYNGGNGAFYDAEYQLNPGQQILVNIGIAGADGPNTAPEWGRDSTINILDNTGNRITTVIIMGGRAYSIFRGFNYQTPWIFNDSPHSGFICGGSGISGSSDSTIQPYSNPCHAGSAQNTFVAQVTILGTNSATKENGNYNGTACDSTYGNSHFNSLNTFNPPIANYTPGLFSDIYDPRAGGVLPAVFPPAGFGNGGTAGNAGTNNLQTSGQNGLGLIYIKSAP